MLKDKRRCLMWMLTSISTSVKGASAEDWPWRRVWACRSRRAACWACRSCCTGGRSSCSADLRSSSWWCWARPETHRNTSANTLHYRRVWTSAAASSTCKRVMFWLASFSSSVSVSRVFSAMARRLATARHWKRRRWHWTWHDCPRQMKQHVL